MWKNLEEGFLTSSDTLEITNFEPDLTEKLVKRLSCQSRSFRVVDRDKEVPSSVYLET